jgi:hypothetical protein
MNIFSLKSIGLYSLAIGSAIVFFQVVTSYGEAKITAPIAITGNYLITAPKLPDCLNNKQLLLTLQQSGIYLNAGLSNHLNNTLSISDRRPTLSGRLQAQKLNLAGLVPTAICTKPSQLHIAAAISHIDTTIAKNTPQLQGQLWLSTPSAPQQTNPIDFTATLQPSNRSTPSH